MTAGGAAVRRGGVRDVIYVMSTRVQAAFEADRRAAADTATDGDDGAHGADHGRPGGERLIFDRWPGCADPDGTPLLHNFLPVTADHSLSTAAAPA